MNLLKLWKKNFVLAVIWLETIATLKVCSIKPQESPQEDLVYLRENELRHTYLKPTEIRPLNLT